MKKIKLISDRDNSKIWLVDEPTYGRCLYKEIYHQPQLPSKGVADSYKLYRSLKNIDKVVKIYESWSTGNIVHVYMEYLDGWRVIEDKHKPEALRIMASLAKEGVIDWDFSFINFMVSPSGQVKMIDLDRLIRIESLPECPLKENWILTWFGSRMIKVLEQL